jgi:hypothetical protein
MRIINSTNSQVKIYLGVNLVGYSSKLPLLNIENNNKISFIIYDAIIYDKSLKLNNLFDINFYSKEEKCGIWLFGCYLHIYSRDMITNRFNSMGFTAKKMVKTMVVS